MNQVGKIFKQAGWQVLGKIVTSLTTLFVLSLVTRNYGAYGTGVYTLSLSYLAFFYLAADFGLNPYFLKLYEREKNFNSFRKLLGLRVILALLFVLLAGVVAFLIPNSSGDFIVGIIFGLLTILGFAVFSSINSVFQYKLRYDLSVIAMLVGTVFSAVLIYLFIGLGFKVSFLMIAHLLGWLAFIIVAIILVSKYVYVGLDFDFRFYRKTILEIWPISVTLALNVVYFRVDSFLIASSKSYIDAGIYNLAYQIFQSALVFPTFLMNAAYPILVKSFEDRALFLQTIKRIFIVLIGLAIIGVLALFLLSPFLIGFISGGRNFRESVNVLNILSLGFPAYFISSLLMWLFIILKSYRSLMYIYLIGLIANVLLNLIFIPKFSYIAASYITGVSEYLILILQVIILSRLFKKYGFNNKH